MYYEILSYLMQRISESGTGEKNVGMAVKIGAILLCVLGGCAWIVGCWKLYIKTFRRRGSPTIPPENDFCKDPAKLCCALKIEKDCSRKVVVSARDGIKLSGWYYERSPSAPLVIFFHGYRSYAALDGQMMLTVAKHQGWNLLLATLRAHGESGGKDASAGAREKYDCQAWAAWAERRLGEKASVFLMGISISGTIVMLSGELPMPAVVRGIIDDSGFTTFSEMCRINARKVLPWWLPVDVFLAGMAFGAALFGRFSIRRLNALSALRKTKLPVLLIHGSGDTQVPVAMAYALYDACGGEKQLVLIPGAEHGQCWEWAPETYEAAIAGFIKAHAVKNAPL